MWVVGEDASMLPYAFLEPAEDGVLAVEGVLAEEEIVRCVVCADRRAS
jgi:hypothetical protein